MRRQPLVVDPGPVAGSIEAVVGEGAGRVLRLQVAGEEERSAQQELAVLVEADLLVRREEAGRAGASWGVEEVGGDQPGGLGHPVELDAGNPQAFQESEERWRGGSPAGEERAHPAPEPFPKRPAHQPVGDAGQDPIAEGAAALHPDAHAGGQGRTGEAPQRPGERVDLLLHRGAEAVVDQRHGERVGGTEGECTLDVLAAQDEQERVPLCERQHELVVPGHVGEGEEVDAQVAGPGAHRRVAAVDGVDDGALGKAHALGAARGAAGEEEQERVLGAHGVDEDVPARVVHPGCAGAHDVGDGELAHARREGSGRQRLLGDHRGEPRGCQLGGHRRELLPLGRAGDEGHPGPDAQGDGAGRLAGEVREERGGLGAERLCAERDLLPGGRVLGQHEQAVARPQAGGGERGGGAAHRLLEVGEGHLGRRGVARGRIEDAQERGVGGPSRGGAKEGRQRAAGKPLEREGAHGHRET